jgi:uncharacterized membrane protein YkoI
MKRTALVAVFVTCLALSAAGAVAAGPKKGSRAPAHSHRVAEPVRVELPPMALRDGISLDQAVARAEAQFNARVVRAETNERDGRLIYVLRLLSDDGRVFTVRIDAATGAIY